MKLTSFVMLICLWAISCSSATKKPKKLVNDTVVKDTVVKVTNDLESPVSVYTVKNNHIDIDSIASFYFVEYHHELEHFAIFLDCNTDNLSYITFENRWLDIGHDSVEISDRASIIGGFATNFSYKQKISYVVLYEGNEFANSIMMISVDSLGGIIDFVDLFSRCGDGGYSRLRSLKEAKKNTYQTNTIATYFRGQPDTLEVVENEKTIITINTDGTFDEKVIYSRKDYFLYGNVDVSWRKLTSED